MSKKDLILTILTLGVYGLVKLGDRWAPVEKVGERSASVTEESNSPEEREKKGKSKSGWMHFRSVVRWFLILSISLLVVFVLSLAYLKNYRLRYCQAKYESGRSGRSWCLEDPIYKFILER